MNIKHKILIGLCLLLIATKSVYADIPPEQWSPQSQELLKSLISDVRETLTLIATAEGKQGHTLEQFQYKLDLDRSYKFDLGLVLEMNDEQSAFEVLSVTPGSLASSHGISANDEIVRVDGIPVTAETESSILKRIQRLKVGESLTLTLSREGANQEILVPVTGRIVPRIRLEIGTGPTNETDYTRETRELLENLALRIQVTAAAINENEVHAEKGEVLIYSIHMHKADFGLDLDVANPKNGFVVLSVRENSQAAELGIEIDDVVITVNQLEVNEANLELILVELSSLGLGDSLALTVKRNTRLSHLTMTVEEDKLPSVDLHIEPGDFEKPLPVANLSTTSSPRIQSGFDDSVDFSQYKTFNFGSQTEISDPDFHNLLLLTFSAATEEQMRSRGYVKSDNPDVLINVSVDVEDKTQAPTQTIGCPSYSIKKSPTALPSSHYIDGKGRGTFCRYTEGLIKIEMVDLKLNRTIWDGVSFVRIDERERGAFLNSFIMRDVDTMFESSPFSARLSPLFSVESNRVAEISH
ncbi:MAG: PDZ domain-containing protein [Porticoccus sp.]|nr:PDZ domain-containing protein [Porticoccus sp.]